ncbi:universal stress protein [Streptomyces sp. AS58]|nr:universal stress protein [Streptomyces sp. AS58]
MVVGIDGSDASLEAVDWASEAAVRHGVPLRLVHATAGGHEASDAVDAATKRARDRSPGVRLSSDVLRKDAASALVDEGRNAFALVLGSRGLGDLPGMLLGSVSLAVAARADCPVVVVRGAAEHQDARFGSIVVGVEDGEGSATAVQFAFREAHVRHCRLVAVHAWSAPAGVFAAPQVPSSNALDVHRRPPAQVLDDALRGPAEHYPDALVSRRLIEGSVRHALLDTASEADLLVVGARRRQGRGLQLGLINHAALHYSPCPIALVPQR